MVSIHFSNSLIALKPPHHLHPPYLSALKPSSFLPIKFPNPTKTTKYTTFRAELSHDAPFATAIGACMLSSLVLPPVSSPSDDPDAGSGIDSTDARFAVMGVVSFIPYFNWLIEASIKNGDLQEFQFFNEAAKHISSMTKKGDHIDGHQGASKKGRERENKNLSFGQEQSRNEIEGWEVPKRPLQDSDLKEDGGDNERRKQ